MNFVANSPEAEQPEGQSDSSGLQEDGQPGQASARATVGGASPRQSTNQGGHSAVNAANGSNPAASDAREQSEQDDGRAPSDRWPSAGEQIRPARQAAMRYFELPLEIRAKQRAKHDRNREMHRASTDYAQLHEELDNRLSAYRDDQFVEQFAREYYAAGASRLLPRMCRERTWVVGEDTRRSEYRGAIISLAERLDAIDTAGGYDSAEDYDPRWDRPPPGDTHVNRTWQILLRADLRQLSRIMARGSITWRSWLRRTALRAAIPVALVALSIWSVNTTGASAWSAVAWAATLLSVWLTWTTATGKKDAFVVAVHDIRDDHYHALVEVDGHLRHGGSTFLQRKPFTRDPSQRPLTELLRQR